MAARRRLTPMANSGNQDLLQRSSPCERGRRRGGSCGTSARCRSWRRWRTAGRWRSCVDEGLPYLEISRRTHASTTTVTRVAHWLRHGEGGYRLRSTGGSAARRRPPDDRDPGQGPAARAVRRAARRRRPRPGGARRARARVPVPQRAGRRAARARRRRARVRAGRRRRLRDHRRRPRPRARRRRRGAAASSASARARSRPPCPRSRRRATLEDLAGLRAATVYPRLARELLASAASTSSSST